ncbi:MAG: hypothetical protein HQK89_03390 [Nitrospirae bacterium]|nr:hypothetical protein [Nitrospirota bacterium]
MNDDVITDYKEIVGNDGLGGGVSKELGKGVANELDGGVKMAYPLEEFPKKSGGKLNCWQFKQCGREPGGKNSVSIGICPVATAANFNGLHGGENGGRACWAVPSTLCENSGNLASKIRNCTTCEFHQLVIKEEKKYQSAVVHMKKAKQDEKARIFKEPGFLKHIYAKSKHTAYDDSFEIDSIFITLLIGWVSLCPSVSMLAGSKRLCKDDLVDELMVIDAIADKPRRRAAHTVAKTMIKAIGRQADGYFEPLFKKISARKKP